MISAIDDPLNSFSQMDHIEIEEQTQGFISALQVSEELRSMNGQQGVDTFELHDYGVLDQ